VISTSVARCEIRICD